MEASLSAILDSKTMDKAAPRTGDAFLQELAQDLSVREQTSPPIHEGLAGIFNGLLSEKMPDDKIKAKLDKYTRPENINGLRTPKVRAMSSPGHEIQSFFTSYLVPHFSEVWKCGKVRQSKDIVALFPQS